MKKLIYLLVLMSFSTTSSCMAASRSSQRVVITSEQSAADILIDGEYKGTTPKTFSFQGNHTHRIIVQKDGYGAQFVDIYPKGAGNRKIRPAKCLSYGLYPFAGAGLGAGTGLILTGGETASYAGLAVVGCAYIGFVAGAVVGLGGLGYYVISGSKGKRSPTRVHFVLQKNEIVN